MKKFKTKDKKLSEDKRWKRVLNRYSRIDDITDEDWIEISSLIFEYGAFELICFESDVIQSMFDLIKKLTTQYLEFRTDLNAINYINFAPGYVIKYNGKFLNTSFCIENLQDAFCKTTAKEFIYNIVKGINEELKIPK